MNHKNLNTFFGVITLLSLALCGWFLYRTPLTDNVAQLKRSNIHFDLARFYAYLGNPQKAEEHLGRVIFNSNKIDLLQIYTAMMLNAASSGDYDAVFKILLRAHDISEAIRKIGFLRDENDHEYQIENYDPSEKEISGVLCLFAGRIFAESMQQDNLNKLIYLPSCDEKRDQIRAYRIAAMILSGGYKEAFAQSIDDLNEPGAGSRKIRDIASVFRQCRPNRGASDLSEEDVAYFLNSTKDQENKNIPYLTAALFQQFNKNEESVFLSKTIEDPFLRAESLMAAYQKHNAIVYREKAIEMVSFLKSFFPPSADGINDGDEVLKNIIFSQESSPFSYELAMLIGGAENRFQALNKIYNSKTKGQEISFPGCGERESQCVINEMIKISESAENAELRDRIYYTISDMQIKEGSYKDALKNYEKIRESNSPVCKNDACEILFSKIPTCIDKLPKQIPGLSTKADMRKIVNCHYVSQYYKSYIVSDDFIDSMKAHQQQNALGNEYLSMLAVRAQGDGLIEESVSLAALIDNPVIRREVILNLWNSAVLRHEYSYLKNNPINAETGKFFLESLMKKPVFLNDQDLWDRIAQNTVYVYWKEYPSRIFLTSEQEKIWSASIWDMVDLIIDKKPHTKEQKCTPRSFHNFHKECQVRNLIAQNRILDAMNLAKIEDKYNAARVILFERFMGENERFRNAMNIQLAFPYIQIRKNECPLSGQ